jgi:hypothetical protein
MKVLSASACQRKIFPTSTINMASKNLIVTAMWLIVIAAYVNASQYYLCAFKKPKRKSNREKC